MSTPRIFNVAYTLHTRGFPKHATRSSVILIDRHPAVWAMQPPGESANYVFVTLDGWNEVEAADVPAVLAAITQQTTLAVEDYRVTPPEPTTATPAPLALPPALRVKPLVWSDEQVPNTECSYNHIVAESPIGRYVIDWKGWKDRPTYSISVDGNYADGAGSLERAKAATYEWHSRRLLACLQPGADDGQAA